MDVGGDDGAAARDFAADEFGLEVFAAGDVLHFFGDDAAAGVMHLREIVARRRSWRRFAFQSKRLSFPSYPLRRIRGEL